MACLLPEVSEREREMRERIRKAGSYRLLGQHK